MGAQRIQHADDSPSWPPIALPPKQEPPSGRGDSPAAQQQFGVGEQVQEDGGEEEELVEEGEYEDEGGYGSAE